MSKAVPKWPAKYVGEKLTFKNMFMFFSVKRNGVLSTQSVSTVIKYYALSLLFL